MMDAQEWTLRRKFGFILLIDDDEEDNEYHLEIIREMHITEKIRSIGHPLKGIRYFDKCLSERLSKNYPLPDLVFLDGRMPMYTGFEFLDDYEKLDDPYGRKEEIKFVLLPGAYNPFDEERIAHYGHRIIEHYTKPLNSDNIKEIINKHFKHLL